MEEEAAVEMLASSDEKDAPGRVESDVKEVLCAELVNMAPCGGMLGA
jgi:hypothetical protein